MPDRKPLKRLTRDDQIATQKKVSDFRRSEAVRDAVNRVTVGVIYAAPVVILILGAIVALGTIFRFNTTILQEWVKGLVIAAGSFVLGNLKKNGIDRDE